MLLFMISYQKLKKYNTAVIVNISAGSVEEYAEMAWRLDIDGVDAVEVNISCPNVKEGGIVFGTDPKAAAAVTHAVKTHTKKNCNCKTFSKCNRYCADGKSSRRSWCRCYFYD